MRRRYTLFPASLVGCSWPFVEVGGVQDAFNTPVREKLSLLVCLVSLPASFLPPIILRIIRRVVRTQDTIRIIRTHAPEHTGA